MHAVLKKGQESPLKVHNYESFSKFRAFAMLHHPKQHVVLKVLIEHKAFYFSKRALRAGTACNKWLKFAL